MFVEKNQSYEFQYVTVFDYFVHYNSNFRPNWCEAAQI